MRLSDIVAHMRLDVFASTGMVLFLGAFLLVAYGALRLRQTDSARFARLPLESEQEAGS